jgi:hypothetical protein
VLLGWLAGPVTGPGKVGWFGGLRSGKRFL